MKEIKFTRESREFVYWEGELVECLMQVLYVSNVFLKLYFYIPVFLKPTMKEIRFTRESREFVYWEGELVECLMQVAPPPHLNLPTLYALCVE